MSQTLTITDILGGPKVLRARVRSEADLVEMTRAGLPFKAFLAVWHALNIDPDTGRQLIHIPSTTFRRRELAGSLSPEESDRLMRVARVVSYATQVFGNVAKAREWLNHPSIALGNVAPLSLLDTEIGTQQVTDELTRIEYGDFA